MVWDMENCKSSMEKSLVALETNLAGIRTGRVNSGLVGHVIVDAYGDKRKLSQMATTDVVDNFTLSIKPFDSSMIGTIEKAISHANLGLSCSAGTTTILAKASKMTNETRVELIKATKKIIEDAKVVVRNVRRDELEKIKTSEKNKQTSKDDTMRSSDALQKLTDGFIEKIEELGNKKIEALQVI